MASPKSPNLDLVSIIEKDSLDALAEKIDEKNIHEFKQAFAPESNIITSSYISILSLSLYSAATNISNYLISKGHTVNDQEQLYAILSGNICMLGLVSNQKKVPYRSIEIAIKGGHLNMLKFLVEQLSLKVQFEKMVSLSYDEITKDNSSIRIEILKYLLTLCNKEKSHFGQIIYDATKKGHYYVIEAILDSGLISGYQNAYCYAVRNELIDIIKLFEKHNLKLDIDLLNDLLHKQDSKSNELDYLIASYCGFTDNINLDILKTKGGNIKSSDRYIYKYPIDMVFNKDSLLKEFSYLEFIDFLLILEGKPWECSKLKKSQVGAYHVSTISIKNNGKNVNVFRIEVWKDKKRISISCYRPYLLNISVNKNDTTEYYIIKPQYPYSKLAELKQQKDKINSLAPFTKLIQSIYKKEEHKPDIVLSQFYGHSIQSLARQKKVEINKEYFEKKGGCLSVTLTDSKSCTLKYDGKRVYKLVFIDSRAKDAINDCNYIELDCTFYSLRPYTVCIPFAIIQNESLPLGISLGTTEKHDIFLDFYNLFRNNYDDTIISKPILSDEGTALKKFVKALNDDEIIHFFCFRHIIEKFGSGTKLGRIVTKLLFTYSIEEFEARWEKSKEKLAYELIQKQEKVEAIEKLFKCKLIGKELSEPDINSIDQLIWTRKKFGVATCSNHCESTHAKLNLECRPFKRIEERFDIIMNHIDKRYKTFVIRRNLNSQLNEYRSAFSSFDDLKKAEYSTHICTLPHCISKREFFSALYGIPFPCIHSITNFNHYITPLKEYDREEGLIFLEEIQNTAENHIDIKNGRFSDSNDDDSVIISHEYDSNKKVMKYTNDKNFSKESSHVISVILKHKKNGTFRTSDIREISIDDKEYLDPYFPKLIKVIPETPNEVFIPCTKEISPLDYTIENCIIIDPVSGPILKNVKPYCYTIYVDIDNETKVKGIAGKKIKF